MSDNTGYRVIIPAAGSSRRLARLTSSRPKALLPVGGQSIIGHSLDVLSGRGFHRVTFVVGYMRDVFVDALGGQHGRLALDYVIAEDFATTEHGWSLFLTERSWREQPAPVIFMDADNLYDPRLLDRVLGSSFDNVVLVDEGFTEATREEELVLGKDNLISGLERGIPGRIRDFAGVFVGINRFSMDFMARLYAFMDPFFAQNGRRHKYERVFDAFIKATGTRLNYVTTAGLAWVNINHEDDYARAESIAKIMAAPAPCRERGPSDPAA